MTVRKGFDMSGVRALNIREKYWTKHDISDPQSTTWEAIQVFKESGYSHAG